MHPFLCTLSSGLLLSLVLSGGPIPDPARAQAPDDLGAFFDVDGIQRILIDPASSALREFHVVAFAPHAGLMGFELGLQVPPEIQVVSLAVTLPCAAADCGWGQGPTNWVVGTGSACYDGEPSWALIGGVFRLPDGISADSLEICVGPPLNPSVTPPAPDYYGCNRTFVPFSLTPATADARAGCARLVNTVPVAEIGWGMVKGEFLR